METLKPYVDEGRDVIFFGISEDMSTTCNVMRMAARLVALATSARALTRYELP